MHRRPARDSLRIPGHFPLVAFRPGMMESRPEEEEGVLRLSWSMCVGLMDGSNYMLSKKTFFEPFYF